MRFYICHDDGKWEPVVRYCPIVIFDDRVETSNDLYSQQTVKDDSNTDHITNENSVHSLANSHCSHDDLEWISIHKHR